MRTFFLVTGLVSLLLLTFVFVPYTVEYRTISPEESGQAIRHRTVYASVTNRPVPGSEPAPERSVPDSTTVHAVSIDTRTLLGHYALLFAIFGGGALLFGRDRGDPLSFPSPVA